VQAGRTRRLEAVVRLDEIGELILGGKRQSPLLDQVERELADVVVGRRPAKAGERIDRLAGANLGEEVVAAVLDAAVEELWERGSMNERSVACPGCGSAPLCPAPAARLVELAGFPSTVACLQD
jgi:hypothetical protein